MGYCNIIHSYPQEKAYEEQLSIFQGSERSPTMKDLNEMKYLDRVIKETLRLYPSVPVIGRKLNTDVNIGEYLPYIDIVPILIMQYNILYIGKVKSFRPSLQPT